jgi:hypothetical protein
MPKPSSPWGPLPKRSGFRKPEIDGLGKTQPEIESDCGNSFICRRLSGLGCRQCPGGEEGFLLPAYALKTGMRI